jgi:DNA-binding transcriptional MerR regulator
MAAWTTICCRLDRLARLAGLSVGALRHYDQLDLLGPADIDRVTGYRRDR